MDIEDFYHSHILDDSVAREAGFNPYYPMIQSGLHDPIIIEGRPFINLASNNYLGLASDIRVAEAAIEGIHKYGVSMCATPIASGYSDLYNVAEDALAHFTGLESSLIFPSCYQANNGLFKMIAGPEDLVIFDRSAHSSLIEGARSAPCANRPFRHNDLDHLENILKHSSHHPNVFVVTESVFSTEGAIAPFREMYELCLHYGAVTVVDDSHGIGVIGQHGKGILEYSGIKKYQGIYTASLGKALAVNGGMVAGKYSLINYLRYFTSHLIYSTSVPPSSLKALLKVLQIIGEDFPELSAKFWRHANRISTALAQIGFDTTSSDTPINSISAGNSVQTLQLAKMLYGGGVLVTPFIFPSVPEPCGRIRIIAGANIRPTSIEKAIVVFERIHQVSSHEMPPGT
jgi:glycine C-acetyltransferase